MRVNKLPVPIGHAINKTPNKEKTMSDYDNDENENENTETEAAEAPAEAPKQRGQTKKTAAELRAAFRASGVKGCLEVETTAKENTRCTVRLVSPDGSELTTIFGPVAGNTFLRALEGAVKMGPHIAAPDAE